MTRGHTFAHDPSLDVPCHSLAIAAEDIIFERLVLDSEDSGGERTRNFGIDPLRVDKKTYRSPLSMKPDRIETLRTIHIKDDIFYLSLHVGNVCQ